MLVSKRWLERQRAEIADDDSSATDTSGVFAKCSPRYEYPHHLSPLIAALDDCESSVLVVRHHAARYIVAAPPQHGKSETTQHWIAGFISRHPHLRHAYVANSRHLARKASKKIMRLVRDLGVKLRKGSQGVDQWETEAGGQFVATSITAHLTGEPIDGLLVIDDPIRSIKQAESEAWRETCWDFWEGTADSRLHPGAAVVIIATRWHEDDLSGRLLERQPDEWTWVCMPAIKDGRALWEGKRPIAWLEKKRRTLTERVWWSLWMGEPLPPGGKLFPPLTMMPYEMFPPAGPEANGVDLAYSDGKKADETACVQLRRGPDGKAYLVAVDHWRAKPTDTSKRVRGFLDTHQGPCLWYASAMESRQLDTYHTLGIGRVRAETTQTPKAIRAQPLIAAAEQGDFVVPEGMPWTDKVKAQLEHFSGQDGRPDDIVDAIVAAFDVLPEYPTGSRVSVPRAKRPLYGAM